VKYANWNYPGSGRTNIVLERHGPHASRHGRGDKSTTSGHRFTCTAGSFVFEEDGERGGSSGNVQGGNGCKRREVIWEVHSLQGNSLLLRLRWLATQKS